MKSTLTKCLLLAGAVFCMASCSTSKKQPSRTGKIIIQKDTKHARVGGKKDNGLHKGWYKNPNNPHHPNTTNPGLTKKQKGKPAKGASAAKGKSAKGKKK